MRIARFSTGGDPQYGVVNGDLDEYGQPAEDATVVALAGDPLYSGINLLEEVHRLADVRLLAPVIPRSKVVAIGKNYADHVAEMKGMTGDAPSEPLMFLKPNTSVVGPGDPILYPRQSENLHYEGELAVVIGRICKDVPKERAADVIHGYTLANDVTARDLQKSDGQWSRAKGFDSFCPLGPWIDTDLTLDDVAEGITLQTFLEGDKVQDGSTRDLQRSDVQFTRAKGFDTFCPLGPWIETDLDPQHFMDGVPIRTHLNGEVVQDGSTADMVFDIPSLVAHVSSVMTLLPGDVILTGTPEGVGPMEVGDEVEVSIAGLGSLTNKVVER